MASYPIFDHVGFGLRAQSLVKELDTSGKGNGTIPMINGAPTDSNAAQFKQGANSVLKKSHLKIGKEYDTPDGSPDQARTEMEQAITALVAYTLGSETIPVCNAALNQGRTETAGFVKQAFPLLGGDPVSDSCRSLQRLRVAQTRNTSAGPHTSWARLLAPSSSRAPRQGG